ANSRCFRRLCATKSPAHFRPSRDHRPLDRDFPANGRLIQTRGGTVSSLLPRRGNSRAKRLNETVEAIIAATLREQWLVEEAPPLAPVVEEIRARCSTAGERPPSYFAVQARIPLLFDAMTIAKARSANPKHVRRLKPRPTPSPHRIRSRSARSTTRPPTSTSSRWSTMPACS